MNGALVGSGEDEDPLLPDRQPCFPPYAATNLIGRLYRPVPNELALTYPQYLVLWEREAQTVGALGARLHLDSGTLTPMLKRMEAAGLLGRRRDPQDERRVLVALTDEGRALRSRALQVPKTLTEGYKLEGSDDVQETIRTLVPVLSPLVAKPSTADAGPMVSGPDDDV